MYKPEQGLLRSAFHRGKQQLVGLHFAVPQGDSTLPPTYPPPPFVQ